MNQSATGDGGNAQAEPTHVNRLIHTSSPYLLQHAHNPVDWYPWGDEAIACARSSNRPIFLSIGYSTCYWCHVMEREVFENEHIAAQMNALFVNIKVDREERPDLDEIYMTATQLMTGGGGWPTSLFLTGELKPFFAGTYFGANDQHGRPGFPSLCRSIAHAWQTRHADLVETSLRVTSAITDAIDAVIAPLPLEELTTAVTDRAVIEVAARYDPQYGGFGGAPKFPQDFYYEFLFDAHQRTREPRTREIALRSLRMMAAGGIHDHIGGGFHRYAVDAQWRIPHFEKMLYNQAQLVRSFVCAYQATGESTFAHTAKDTLDFVAQVMTDPMGGFSSALDAETDGVEGAYYGWQRSEIDALLNPEQRARFDAIFGLGTLPTFPGHKHPSGDVLFMRRPIAELAESLQTPVDELTVEVDALVRILKSRRDTRTLPRLDDKVIVAWNGMMIHALAMASTGLAGSGLDGRAWIATAARSADFVLTNMRDSGGHLWRLWRSGRATQRAFHEDYAFFIRGLLALHTATAEARWLTHAVELARICDELFWDGARGGYFVAQESGDLIARSKLITDGAIPSSNSAMLHNLISLGQATGDHHWQHRTEAMLCAFGSALANTPSAHIHMVHGLELWLRGRA